MKALIKYIGIIIASVYQSNEKHLFQVAKSIEQDSALHKEMQDWDVAISDGIDSLY